MRNFPLLKLIVLASIAVIFSACEKPQDNMAENLSDYFTKDAISTTAPEGRSVYIDNSDGLFYAYTSDNDNARIMESITQKLTGDAIQWYALSNNEIVKLDYSSTDLYKKVTDKDWYCYQIAPIEKTLQKIVDEGHEALLVTDFEEYKKSVDGKYIICYKNFAKKYFCDWLERNNSIDFIITDYEEAGRTKHLYFIMFNTPEKTLKSDIEYALKDRGYRYDTFSLSTDIYAITNEYPSVNKAGIYYDNNLSDLVCAMQEDKYVNGLQKSNKNYEFCPFGCTWGDMYKNSIALQEPGIEVQFTDFFRKLYIDISADDVYKIEKLGVKVSDISADYTLYVNSKKAEKHKPTMTKDANGSDIADFSGDLASEQYYNYDGTIKPEYVYSSQAISEFKEVFELNQELFENGVMQDKSKVEIGIGWHKNFNVPNPSGLLRVDIVIEKCVPNFSNLVRYFTWSEKERGTNNNLSEAIRNTIDKVNPQGKIVYTYFIRSGECEVF